MSIIRPTKVLLNKDQILEMAELLIDLKKTLETRHTIDVPAETLQWALEQSIMRLSLRDGHQFE